MDRAGVIVAATLTPGSADDTAQVGDWLEAVPGRLASFTGDAAHDTGAVYEAAKARGAHVIVRAVRNARPSGRSPRSRDRDRTVRRVWALGRRRWMKESGHHGQATVENTFFRYETILGSSLRARQPDAQRTEARIACGVLNRMLELARPASYAIGA